MCIRDRTRPALVRENTRDAIFWDRSATEATANESDELETTELDYDYLNDPTLQRRRSQMSLFNGIRRSSSKNTLNTVSNLTTALKQQSQPQQSSLQYSSSNDYLKRNNKHRLSSDYIYDPNEPEMNTRYRIHYDQTNRLNLRGSCKNQTNRRTR